PHTSTEINKKQTRLDTTCLSCLRGSQTRSRSTQNREENHHHEVSHYRRRHCALWLVTNGIRSRPDVAKSRHSRKADRDSRSWQTDRCLSRPFRKSRAGQSTAIGRLAQNAGSQ